jgi:hypothetical protein
MIRRSKKAVSRNRMILALDAACRARVMERDGCCQRCGATISSDGSPLQWSHCHSHRHYCLRWDDENSKILCKGCHCWWTNNPGLAFDFFSKKWPERWERITKVLQSNPKVRVKDLYEELRTSDVGNHSSLPADS